MSGSATLGTSLVDRLVPKVIDGLRRKLHPKFGVRAYTVHTVARTWSGGSMGEGTASDVVVELDPQPKVKIWDGLRYSLEPCGLDEAGEIQLTEISLTYTQAELDGGGALAQNQEWLIRVDEAHGQENRSAFYIHTRRPFVDREKDMAWVAWLRKVDV